MLSRPRAAMLRLPLQPTLEQQSQLPHLGRVIYIRLFLHLNRQSTVVLFAIQLIDEFAVVHFALANTDLQVGFVRVSQVHVVGVADQIIEATFAMRPGEVVTWVESHAKSFHVVT